MHLLLLNLLIHLQYWALEALGKSAYRHVTMVISSQLRRLYVPASVFWLLWKAIGPNKCVPRALLVPPQQHKSTSSNSLLLGLLAHFPNWEALRFLSALLDTSILSEHLQRCHCSFYVSYFFPCSGYLFVQHILICLTFTPLFATCFTYWTY